ncbi:probable cysteine--tRNA ligase, mitochondrial isoform X2 [Anolis carolinensis]|uniref:cysteine--tRNA ligase n=1 Tax=Anolis carolinensis TaxID=28377 RepID=G1KF26_ANOCA|nr:PREDICTED: probable cysteine--tRNA ligase, mitochondrial isoform X1 [Anolis carolinensis]|eukprot:XP_008105205.1 PREDICTED: probable cysteine--tRNA ligase, mitochondrial isoform X1 [Anolis carolinensis]
MARAWLLQQLLLSPARARLRAASPALQRMGLSSGGAKWLQPRGPESGIQTYNSLSKSKEPLVLRNPDVVTWYSCGPTVYDHAHLGHACSYVRFDIIRRIMTRLFGKEVVMVMGITDIDDKIIKRANEMGISPLTLARFYEEDFKQDMAALKVLPPTVYMRVTENIPQIISFIQKIIASRHGYATSKGNVYFDVRSRGERYGKLANIYPDAQEEPVDSDKSHVKDFALWKAAKPQEMCWDSPWGKGRPGWHIECSTISSLVFGGHLDIHTGGIDLAFPHHENEIAQCEVYHQCDQWANYFLHSGHLHVKGSEKMSKSLKNYITIKDFLKEFSSDQFRMLCLRSRYRAGIEYSDDHMSEAKSILQIIYFFLSSVNAYMKGQLLCEDIREDVLWERLAHTKAAVRAACADDFDTPRAVGAIMDLIHHGNRQLKAVTKETGSPRSAMVFGAIVSYIVEFLNTVGIALSEGEVTPENKHSAILSSVIDELVSFRTKVRNFALAAPEATGGDMSAEHAVPSKEAKQRQKEERQRLLKERETLLQACDDLRQDLSLYGITIKDRSTTSTWELREPSKELENS